MEALGYGLHKLKFGEHKLQKLDRIHLMGLNYGALVHMQYAYAYPQHVKSLVIEKETMWYAEDQQQQFKENVIAQMIASVDRGDLTFDGKEIHPGTPLAEEKDVARRFKQENIKMLAIDYSSSSLTDVNEQNAYQTLFADQAQFITAVWDEKVMNDEELEVKWVISILDYTNDAIVDYLSAPESLETCVQTLKPSPEGAMVSDCL